MIARLTDPWFEAAFYGQIEAGNADQHQGGSFTMQDSIDGAQGVTLWCPCGYGKPEFPLDGGRPHAIIIPFANPRGAPSVPEDHGPKSADNPTGPRPRWQLVSGASLADLTLAPSVAVGSDPQCWHGWIQSGEVR